MGKINVLLILFLFLILSITLGGNVKLYKLISVKIDTIYSDSVFYYKNKIIESQFKLYDDLSYLKDIQFKNNKILDTLNSSKKELIFLVKDFR